MVSSQRVWSVLERTIRTLKMHSKKANFEEQTLLSILKRPSTDCAILRFAHALHIHARLVSR